MATATRLPLYGQDQKAAVPQLDGWLLVSSSYLLLLGLASLYSEGAGRPGIGMFPRQLFNCVIGLGPFFLFLLVDPKVWWRMSWVLYAMNVALLAVTLKMGDTAGGAQRWIDLGPVQFQPSEAAKLFTVFTLSAFFANRRDIIDKPATFLLSMLHIAAPAALIFLQPHLGATLVILVIWLCVSLAASVPFRYILGSAIAAVVLVGLAFSIPGVMKDYQKSRVVGLFSSEDDPLGKGFQTSRAQIAFAMGGVMGEGFLKGQQKRGRHIPEQHTDFIFSVIGEEGGLVGTTLALGGFGFFFYRIWLVMLRAVEPFERMVVAGIYGMLAFHMFVNIGMLVGIVPVVGLWLPFMSYGGTALWLCMACVGLLLAIRRREKPVLF